MSEAPSLLSHVSIPVADVDRALTFYDAVMPTIGATRVFEEGGEAVAYGRAFPEFWIHPPFDGKAPQTGNGWHVAFLTSGPADVDAFYKAALAAGARCDGAPGPREAYGPGYYGAFVRDPDGNKIEAMFFDPEA